MFHIMNDPFVPALIMSGSMVIGIGKAEDKYIIMDIGPVREEDVYGSLVHGSKETEDGIGEKEDGAVANLKFFHGM